MSIEKLVEEQIKEAMARGEFDNLAGKGQPLNLEVYFQTPEELRMCYSVLKNGNFVPEEVQTLKEVESLKEQLAVCTDEEQKRKLVKTINEKMLTINLAIERYKRKK
jgi:hypothetical protein